MIDQIKQNEDKRPTGRPTKYSDDMIEKAEQYLSKCKDAYKLPTVEELAYELGVNDDTIVVWASQRVLDEKGNETKDLLHPEFSATYKRLMNMQKYKLMNDGTYGGKSVNSSMAIFLLKANHGMVETTYIDHSTKGRAINSASLEAVELLRGILSKSDEELDELMDKNEDVASPQNQSDQGNSQ